MLLQQHECHDRLSRAAFCRVVAVIRTYMTYVWGFGVAKPVAGLQPQTVGADEDREGVRTKPAGLSQIPQFTEFSPIVGWQVLHAAQSNAFNAVLLLSLLHTDIVHRHFPIEE